ncbi:MAG: alpha/beta hydrolase [Parvularculaceae bacterium]
MKRILFGLGGLVAAIAIAFLFLRTPDTNREDMIAKYGGPHAMFAQGADGLRVHWRDEGCRDCPAIILIHGSNASLHTWTLLVKRLGGEYRIITYDQPGHGLTGPHPHDDYTAAGMIEALSAVAGAAGVNHFYLGGNSMGGWVAWRYALAHPDRVDGLILIDAAGAPLRAGQTPPDLPLGFKLLRNPFLRPLVSQITPRSLVKKSLLQSVSVTDIVTEDMVDRYWELNRFPGNRHATAIRAVTDREDSYAERLGDIATPTLIIWGAEDKLAPATEADTFNELIPYSEKIVFDHVGHLPMEEVPDKTAGAIRRFLEGLQPQASDALSSENGR